MSSSCCSVKQEAPAAKLDKIKLYKPLIIITFISLLMGAALSIGMTGPFMQMTMGSFLTLISLLKLFDVKGFAEAFSKYDPLAKTFPFYARAYPYIEMALGLLFFSGLHVTGTNIATILVLGITTIGVLQALRKGEDLKCGCAGTAFALPVGRVTVIENVVMILMAALHFVH